MSTDNQKKSFQNWYAANKEKLAEKRAKKYRNDPAYRQAALDRAARQRAANQKSKKESDKTIRIIDGVEREVFRIGMAAHTIGRDEQTIRLWEKRGLIPKPTAPGTHRYYTQVQIGLMMQLCDLIGPGRTAEGQQKSLEEVKQSIYNHWKG